jgi:exodeoxyribonuclease VIII
MIIKDLKNNEYHSNKDYLSSSDLKLLLQDPLVFYSKHYEGVSIEYGNKLAMELGSYIHALLLEPEIVDQEFIVFDGKRQGKRYDEFKEQHKEKIIIGELSASTAHDIVSTVRLHELFSKYLVGGSPEISLMSELNGVPIKVRADYLIGNTIVDIKTSSKPVDFANFKQTIENYKYDLSAALYVDAFTKFTGQPHEFVFIAICKNPVSVMFYKASKNTLENGRILYKKALDLYKECKDKNEWSKPLIEEI